jgi:PAS domain S-box-containing protein
MTDHNEKRQAALLSWMESFAPFGVITLDESFRVQSWNHWMEVHSGLPSEKVIGQNLLELFPDLAERKLVAPFARALLGESSVLSTALHRYLLPMASTMSKAENEHMRQTARIAPLHSDGAVCGILVVIEDVTQRETQSEALGRQHRRDETLSWASAHFLKSEEPRKTIRQLFFKIAEHLDFDSFFVYFRDLESGKLSLYTSGGVSKEAEEDFRNYPLLSHVAEAQQPALFVSVQSRSEPEYAILRQAGISAAVAIPLIANDRCLGLLCFATWSRDAIATEERNLLATIAQYLATAVDRETTSNQLQKAKNDLADHAKILEEKVTERTSSLQEIISELEMFSYTLAHDLQAPVRAMSGYLHILQNDFAGSLPPAAAQIVQRMAQTPGRMASLIQDLVQFSEVSRQEITLAPVDLNLVVEDLLILHDPTVRQALTLRQPLHLVRAHKSLLQHVLSNLVDNAFKFVQPPIRPEIIISTEVVKHSSPSTRTGPLLFSAEESAPCANDAASPEATPARVRIWVIDNGIGIAPDAHQKIFGIFERGESAQKYEGTGMGLAIVARAVQRMGGTCGLESEPGQGSRFWIELPAA